MSDRDPRTADIKGTLYAFFGDRDPLIPNDQTEQIGAILQAHNSSIQCSVSGRTWFFCDRHPDSSAPATSKPWNQVRQLFKHL